MGNQWSEDRVGAMCSNLNYIPTRVLAAAFWMLLLNKHTAVPVCLFRTRCILNISLPHWISPTLISSLWNQFLITHPEINIVQEVMIRLKGYCQFHQSNDYHSLSSTTSSLQPVTLDAVPIMNLILQRDFLYDIGYLAIIPALQFCQLSKWIIIFWQYIMGQKLQSPQTRLRDRVIPHTAHDTRVLIWHFIFYPFLP